MPEINPFEKNPNYTSSYPTGKNFGHPLLNLAALGLIGPQNLLPELSKGQDIFGALLERTRSADFFNLNRSSFLNSMPMAGLGLSNNPFMGMLAGLASSPDSMAGKMMSFAAGGNPMAASSQLYGGLTGGTTMSAFNRIGTISTGETQAMMQNLAKSFYTQQSYEGQGGIKEDLNRKARNVLGSYADRVNRGELGVNVFEEMGIKGINTEYPGGQITKESRERLANLSVAAGSGTEEERNIRENLVSKRISAGKTREDISDISAILDKEGKDLSKEASDAIVDRLKNKFKLVDSEIDKFRNTQGDLDRNKISSVLQTKASEANDLETRLTDIENIYNQSAQYQKTGKRVTGFNFENSRGFKLEDFTGGFVRAADLRMLGESQNISPSEAMRRFSQNAGGAMSAARSLFGNLSGGELIQKISDITGAEGVDLTSQEGSSKIEKRLRKITAAARVSGVSGRELMAHIDAAREMVSQNPQLQYSNTAAIADITADAFTSAADIGRGMSSAEYRSAGGARGLATTQIKQAAAFGESPLGSAMSALLYAAKGNKKAEDLIKSQIASGKFTARGLESGGLKDIADAMGKSVAETTALSQNTLMAQYGLKDYDIAKTVYGKEGQKAGAQATLDYFEDYAGGSREDLMKKYKQYKAQGKSFSDFEKDFLLPHLTTTESQNMYASQKSNLQSYFINESRTPEEAARAAQETERQAKIDEELSKKFDAARAEPATQALHAIMQGNKVEGYDMDAAIAAATGMISTKSQNHPELKEALDKAASSVKGAMGSLSGLKNEYDLTGAQGTDVVEGLNALIDLNRSDLRNQGYTDEAEKVQNLTAEELSSLSKNIKHLGVSSAEEARSRMAELEADEKSGKLSEGQAEQLATLRSANSLGLLRSERGFRTAQRGGAKAVFAGAFEAEQEAATQEVFSEQKKGVYSSLEEDLARRAKEGGVLGADAAKMLEEYKNAGGAQTLLSDLAKGGETAEALNKKYGKSGILAVTNEYQDKLNMLEKQQAEAMPKSPAGEDGQAKLIGALNNLTETLISGGKIGEALSNFASALLTAK